MKGNASHMQPACLSSEALQAALEKLPGWEIKQGKLSKTYLFFDFQQAMAFANKVAVQAEQVNHHPDIHIAYNRVELTLSTHDANGITEKDIRFAQEMDPNY